jgi:hypothetical protein
MMCVNLHNVPEDRPTSDLYHWLWTDRTFFRYPGAHATR